MTSSLPAKRRDIKTKLDMPTAVWQRYLLLSILTFFTILLSCSQSPNIMVITGTVTSYETNSELPNAEINLTTYKQPELVQLPPIGDTITTVLTNTEGVYKFDIQLSSLPADANKLVVSVDRGVQGWKAITPAKGVITVDLVAGSIPVP